MHPPSEVKGPCSGAEPRAGRSCFPMCCSEQSSDLSLSFHLIFIAALLNFVSKYKVTVAPRNRASSIFLNFNYMVFNTTLGCTMPLVREAFREVKFTFFQLLSSTFLPVASCDCKGCGYLVFLRVPTWKVKYFGPPSVTWDGWEMLCTCNDRFNILTILH